MQQRKRDSCRRRQSLYLNYLEQKKKQEQKSGEQKRELVTAKELLNEASTKMAVAIQHCNMQSDKVTQMMLEAGNYKQQETSNKMDVIQSNQQSRRKRLDSRCGNEDKLQAKKKKM